MKKPVIGITVSFDSEDEQGLIPGKALQYVSAHFSRAVDYYGGWPVLIPPAGKGCLQGIVDLLDGIIVTGGMRSLSPESYEKDFLPGLEEQNPARYSYDSFLIREALERNVPLLGICRGHQMLNEVTGGTTYLKLKEAGRHRKENGDPAFHYASAGQGTLLEKAAGPGRILVNSYHAQAVDAVGPGIIISGRAEDGSVEAIESTGHAFAVGLQFHPELMPAAGPAHKIFGLFCKACRQ